MTSISREKLYEMVWAKPMGQVAVELGASSFKLVDICAALNVPRPISGHWNKLAAGKPVQIFPLPEPAPGDPLSWTAGQSPRSAKPRTAARAPRTGPNAKPVGRPLPVHPLVRGARDHFLKTREVRDEGYLKPYKYCLVDIRVRITPRVSVILRPSSSASRVQKHGFQLTTGNHNFTDWQSFRNAAHRPTLTSAEWTFGPVECGLPARGVTDV